jgi:hypothetical protein
MKTRSLRLAALVAASLPMLSPVASADPDVRVVVTGVVENNAFTSGTFAGVPVGAPVTLTIDLDSTNYLDSAALPGRVRGYRFTPATCELRVGSVVTTLRASPQSPAYFVIRNDDPRADGFFISQGTDIDSHIPLQMTPNNYGIAFLRTFGNIPPTPPGGPDPTLTSVNLLGALGSWAYDNLSVYNFAIQLGEFSVPMIFEYRTISLRLITCPSPASQPQPVQACEGGEASFTAAFEGYPAPTVRWQHRPSPAGAWVNLADGPVGGLGTVAGSTGGTLSITGLEPGAGGEVRCVATNRCGEANSDAAALAVAQCPACDPDVNQDGNVDQDDVAYLINVVGGGANPTGIDPDFNQDGNVDQDDIAALINVVAGGNCP